MLKRKNLEVSLPPKLASPKDEDAGQEQEEFQNGKVMIC